MKQIPWVLAGLGIWVAVSPWILGFSSVNLPRWSNVLAGGLVAIGAFSLTSRG